LLDRVNTPLPVTRKEMFQEDGAHAHTSKPATTLLHRCKKRSRKNEKKTLKNVARIKKTFKNVE